MSDPAEPAVSIVTPFYNTADYLAECIESVLAQTYQNWEYVLVNNCSTDRSAEIALHYAQREPRIRLLHNREFLGQVENYNHALRQISEHSRYCKMVQADDWIFPTCISEMVKAAENCTNAVLVSAFSLCETELVYAGLPYSCHVLSGSETIRRYLSDNLALFGSPTCVMYRAREVRSREKFFDPASPADDMQACFDLLLNGDLAFVHQVLTFTRRQGDSIWSGISAYGPTQLHRLYLTHRYAARVFGEEECNNVIRHNEAEYYAFLGEALIGRWPAGFWKYHREGLRKVGVRIRNSRLAISAVEALADVAANPKASMERVLARRSRRRRVQR